MDNQVPFDPSVFHHMREQMTPPEHVINKLNEALKQPKRTRSFPLKAAISIAAGVAVAAVSTFAVLSYFRGAGPSATDSRRLFKRRY